MKRLFLLVFSSSLIGLLLAQSPQSWPVRPGLVGAGFMLALAWWARERWKRDPVAPEAPERNCLLSLSGTLIVLAHLLASLWQIGPAMELHSAAAHAMALDNWILFFAALLSIWIARAPSPVRDERDLQITAAAFRIGHWSLVLQLLALVLWMGFGRDALLEQTSRAMLAQMIVCFWIASCVIQNFACLLAYARDHRLASEAA
jgi:hypothetical protein